MQKPDIWKLVLAIVSPTAVEPSGSDWRAYIWGSITPEVRTESVRFFGATDDYETRYPGLDYTNPGHRLRLSAFPNHRKLFAAFDQLRLTDGEIHALCRWRGTRRARADFERKNNYKIVDTTWDGVDPYQSLQPTVTVHAIDRNVPGALLLEQSNTVQPYENGTENTEYEDGEESEEGEEDEEDEEDDGDDGVPDIESEDELQQSIGVELNERLRANAQADVEARARGDSVTMDAQWEQWLKEAAERGLSSDHLLTRPTDPNLMNQWVRELSSVAATAGVGTSQASNQSRTMQAEYTQAQHHEPQQRQSPSSLLGVPDDPELTHVGVSNLIR